MTENEIALPLQESSPAITASSQDPVDSPESTGDFSDQTTAVGSPPAGRPSIVRWTLIVLVALGVCGWLANWGMHSLMDADSERWIRRFREHTIVREQLGRIEIGEYDWYATFQEPNEETVVYSVRGPKGTGRLVVTEFGMRIPHVELRKDNQNWVLQKGVEDERRPTHE